MSVKGQIVIPSKIRRRFGIKAGTRVQIDVDEQKHRIILTPVTRDYIPYVTTSRKCNSNEEGRHAGLDFRKTTPHNARPGD